MAAIVALGNLFNTTGGDKAITATPTVGDLLVAVATSSANPPTAMADNNPDGLGTWTLAATLNGSGGGNTLHIRIYVRDALITSATSTVFTSTQASSSGGGLRIVRVTGMSRAGTAAIRSSGTNGNTGSGTPSCAMSAGAFLTANPGIGAVINATNPATMTQPSGWTEANDLGYATPGTGLESVNRDSGETASTITWASSSASGYVAAVVELDTSSAGTTVQVSTPGAVTFTGSTVALLTSLIATPGSVTWTGSSLSLVSSLALSPGAVTWTGQTVGLRTALVVVPGVITWTGATDITLTATGGTTVNVDVPGAITWTGQALGLKTSIPVTAGAMTWTGQAVGLKVSVAPTAGAVTWTGQSVGLVTKVQPTPGAITWTGSSGITLSGTAGTTVNVDVPGAVTWTGQTVGLRTSIALSPGVVTWTGQTVGLVETIPVTAGAMTWTGQAVGLRTLIGLSPGAITWTGQDVSVIDSGSTFDLFDELFLGTPEGRWFAELVDGTWSLRPIEGKWRTGEPKGTWDTDPPSGRWLSLRKR